MPKNATALTSWAKAIRKALVLYQNPDLLRRYQRNGMRADFSWARTASQYLEIYQQLSAQR